MKSLREYLQRSAERMKLWNEIMEFKEIQSALKTLKTSLDQHEIQKTGYEKTIVRLHELEKTVPSDSAVLNSLCVLTTSLHWVK